MSIGESLPYRSPISKLLRFFCRSRDKWKAKCKEAKRENKSLKYRLAKMTEAEIAGRPRPGFAEDAKAETTIVAEETTKNNAHHGDRGPRRRPARLGVAAAG